MRAPVMALLFASLVAGPARADPVADFYRGKTVTALIGYEAGGGYDLYARVLARHIGRHIPGEPAVVPLNMPGAASMVAANNLAKVAPRDGTVFGAVNSALLLDTLIAGANSRAQFKAPDMSMLGSVSSNASILIATRASGVSSIDDIRARGVVLGATALSSDSYLSALSFKKALGLDAMKIISGYPGTRELTLAMERGELGARVWDMEALNAQKPDWLKSGAATIIAELAPRRMPEVPAAAPLARDGVADARDREALDIVYSNTLAYRPYLAPPGLPPERLAALRKAFMDTMADPDFLAEMKKTGLGVSPTSGAELQAIVAKIYAADDEVVRRVRALTTP